MPWIEIIGYVGAVPRDRDLRCGRWFFREREAWCARRGFERFEAYIPQVGPKRYLVAVGSSPAFDLGAGWYRRLITPRLESGLSS